MSTLVAIVSGTILNLYNMNVKLEQHIKFKRLSAGAIIPAKAHPSDAGFDIATPVDITIPARSNKSAKLDIGLSMAIPDGYMGMILPRSSTGKQGLRLANTAGIIDAHYRGPITVYLLNDSSDEIHFTAGQRILQLIIVPIASFGGIEVDSLDDTDRSHGGFGSTGQ